ncbi:MAG TPA: S26 family signal peptidase [Syntrophales bacterium]|nr:S26 family signal peptidase [Syntrophales bacterium]
MTEYIKNYQKIGRPLYHPCERSSNIGQNKAPARKSPIHAVFERMNGGFRRISVPKQVKELSKTRRPYIVACIVITLAFYLGFEYVASRYIIAFTRGNNYCLPYSLWLVDKTQRPTRGDYACFIGRGIPNFEDGIKWVKILSGMPGDVIETDKYAPQERHLQKQTRVEVNGLVISMRPQGRVYINDAEYIVYERDTKGRPLPMIAAQTIPAGKYFVHATSPRSFDSRYWGLIDENSIVGKATPIY